VVLRVLGLLVCWCECVGECGDVSLPCVCNGGILLRCEWGGAELYVRGRCVAFFPYCCGAPLLY